MYNFRQMLLFEVCTLNGQKNLSFNSSNFKELKFTTLIYKYCWKSGKKKRFCKKKKNLNALDTYLSRKDFFFSKSTLFKITPHVTKNSLSHTSSHIYLHHKLQLPFQKRFHNRETKVWHFVQYCECLSN